MTPNAAVSSRLEQLAKPKHLRQDASGNLVSGSLHSKATIQPAADRGNTLTATGGKMFNTERSGEV